MRLTRLFLVIFAAFTLAANAATPAGDGVITIKVSKSAKTYMALVEKWADQYMQTNPSMCIRVVTDKNAEADLTLVNGSEKDEHTTPVARYALLPVTSTANPLLSDIQKKEWRGKDLRQLFFTAADVDEEYEEEVSKKNKLTDRLTVYTSSSRSSATSSFASYFGRTTDDIKGNKIAGDDGYLLSAIKEDKASVTFNPLSNVYDLSSRQVRSDLFLLPLNLKKPQMETLANGTLDQVLQLIEEENIDLVPVATVGLSAQNFDKDVDSFLTWIVSKGQDTNHEMGFLRIKEQDSAQIIRLLAQEK